MIIKTKKFILRPHRRGDEKSLQKNINDINVSRFMSSRVPFPYKIKDAKWWVSHCLKLGRKKNPSEVSFAIDIGGEVIGGLGIMYKGERHMAEIDRT